MIRRGLHTRVGELVELWVDIFAEGIGTPLRVIEAEVSRDSLSGSEGEKSLGDHGDGGDEGTEITVSEVQARRWCSSRPKVFGGFSWAIEERASA
jgi:hypothetical protein